MQPTPAMQPVIEQKPALAFFLGRRPAPAQVRWQERTTARRHRPLWLAVVGDHLYRIVQYGAADFRLSIYLDGPLPTRCGRPCASLEAAKAEAVRRETNT